MARSRERSGSASRAAGAGPVSPSEVARTSSSMSMGNPLNWFRKHRPRGEGDNSIHEGVVLRTALKAAAPAAPKTGNLQIDVEYSGFPEGSVRAGETRLRMSISVIRPDNNQVEGEVEDVDSHTFAGLSEGPKTVLLRTRETLISAVPTKVLGECCTAVKVSLRKIPCGAKVCLSSSDIYLEGCTAALSLLDEATGRFVKQCETRINSAAEAVFLVDRHEDIAARKYKLVIADEEGKQVVADIFPIRLKPFLMSSILECQPVRHEPQASTSIDYSTALPPVGLPAASPEPSSSGGQEDKRTEGQLRALLSREQKRLAELEIAYMKLLGEKETLLKQAADLRGKLECPLCFQNLKNVVLLPCRHEYCCDCIMKDKSVRRGSHGEALAASCPICRVPYSEVLCREFLSL